MILKCTCQKTFYNMLSIIIPSLKNSSFLMVHSFIVPYRAGKLFVFIVNKS